MRWTGAVLHITREARWRDGNDVDVVHVEGDDAAACREGPVGKAANVVTDTVQRAKPPYQALSDSHAGGKEEARPEANSGRRR
jgi:hypothetical protein